MSSLFWVTHSLYLPTEAPINSGWDINWTDGTEGMKWKPIYYTEGRELSLRKQHFITKEEEVEEEETMNPLRPVGPIIRLLGSQWGP